MSEVLGLNLIFLVLNTLFANVFILLGVKSEMKDIVFKAQILFNILIVGIYLLY